jgi:hypothetical protein
VPPISAEAETTVELTTESRAVSSVSRFCLTSPGPVTSTSGMDSAAEADRVGSSAPSATTVFMAIRESSCRREGNPSSDRLSLSLYSLSRQTEGCRRADTWQEIAETGSVSQLACCPVFLRFAPRMSCGNVSQRTKRNGAYSIGAKASLSWSKEELTLA